MLALYARHGARLMRESAAGPIGTGTMLGMLGLGVVWLAEVPFAVAALWWQRRHDVTDQGYVDALLESFMLLGGAFLAISFALLVAMVLARLLRGWWWLAAAPLFVGLALLTAWTAPFLIPDVHRARDAELLADVRALAREQGLPAPRVEVQDVSGYTDEVNAMAAGLGATQRVIVWDTLLDGRFDRDEVRTVLAHELAHLSHEHVLESVGWLALFLLPASAWSRWSRAGGAGSRVRRRCRSRCSRSSRSPSSRSRSSTWSSGAWRWRRTGRRWRRRATRPRRARCGAGSRPPA